MNNNINQKEFDDFKKNNIKRNQELFIKAIEENLIDAFFSFEKENNEQFYNSNFEYYINHLDDLYNISLSCKKNEYNYNINFFKNKIILLFNEAKKVNWNLLSIFKDDNEKNKFYSLLRTYPKNNWYDIFLEMEYDMSWKTKDDEKKIIEQNKINQEKLDNKKIEEIKKEINKDENELYCWLSKEDYETLLLSISDKNK